MRVDEMWMPGTFVLEMLWKKCGGRKGRSFVRMQIENNMHTISPPPPPKAEQWLDKVIGEWCWAIGRGAVERCGSTRQECTMRDVYRDYNFTKMNFNRQPFGGCSSSSIITTLQAYKLHFTGTGREKQALYSATCTIRIVVQPTAT